MLISVVEGLAEGYLGSCNAPLTQQWCLEEVFSSCSCVNNLGKQLPSKSLNFGFTAPTLCAEMQWFLWYVSFLVELQGWARSLTARVKEVAARCFGAQVSFLKVLLADSQHQLCLQRTKTTLFAYPEWTAAPKWQVIDTPQRVAWQHWQKHACVCVRRLKPEFTKKTKIKKVEVKFIFFLEVSRRPGCLVPGMFQGIVFAGSHPPLLTLLVTPVFKGFLFIQNGLVWDEPDRVHCMMVSEFVRLALEARSC